MNLRTRSVVAGLFVGAALVAPSTALATKPAPDHKVTICHRTNSDTNPYVIETVDIASSGHLQGGHDTQHEGPIWSLGLKDQHIEWGDIIPPYQYEEFTYGGQNWTGEGQAILENGCELVVESEEPSETPSESPSEPVGTETPSDPVESEAPSGNVESETGTPELTPPPTDTIAADQGATADPTVLLLLLGSVAAAAGLATDRARARTRR